MVKIKDMVKSKVRVSVSVSYIMTIWRWEEFSRCDKFPTTPAPRGEIGKLSDGRLLAFVYQNSSFS